MKILLIQAYLGRREPPVAPLALATLAASLAGHEVRLLDPNIAQQPLPETIQVIQQFQPDFIGLSLRNIDTTKYSDPFLYFDIFPEYVKTIRAAAPQAFLAVGGSGFTLFPERILHLIPELDAGCTGEAEQSLPAFIDQGLTGDDIPGFYTRHDGQIVNTRSAEPADLNQLPPPAWHLIDLKPYLPYAQRAAIGVETKRGCALYCAYCTYPNLSGNALRLKDPQRVVAEIVRLRQDHQVRHVFFTDPVFNYPPEHAVAVCAALIDARLDVTWSAYHQDRDLTPDYVRLAREAGCREFYFSPDASSQTGLKALQKTTTVVSLNRSLQIIQEDREARASYNFFAAVPDTGWRNLFESIRFLLRAEWKLGKRLLRWKLSYIRLEPNTPLARRMLGDNADFSSLLPLNQKEFRALFFRKSKSVVLNIFYFIHFNWGSRFGKRNTLPEDVSL